MSLSSVQKIDAGNVIPAVAATTPPLTGKAPNPPVLPGDSSLTAKTADAASGRGNVFSALSDFVAAIARIPLSNDETDPDMAVEALDNLIENACVLMVKVRASRS
ncbi:hypothetical protein F1640_18475 [Novosphingobium sp. NBM11]|uniref:hypothetical protein n=1 Tax=Novosphingobium sp. NBM11 TaxID=2596914 RepID=UPI001892296B|nr:hypothetical protein [Novosphingobium sp. NBM11]MBF5091942.1 hypothetical protein [Novosphingobium sp. NBM11]